MGAPRGYSEGLYVVTVSSELSWGSQDPRSPASTDGGPEEPRGPPQELGAGGLRRPWEPQDALRNRRSPWLFRGSLKDKGATQEFRVPGSHGRFWRGALKNHRSPSGTPRHRGNTVASSEQAARKRVQNKGRDQRVKRQQPQRLKGTPFKGGS